MHALLQRQIARHLDGVDVTAAPWATFLEAVNQSYIEAEIDRNLVETAMEISSHELLQANAELRALIQVFPDLILHVDGDGHIASSRGRAARTFGARPGGIVGQVLRDLFPESEREAFDAALVTARHSGEVVTLEHTSHDGSLVVHEMRLASLGEGGVVAIVRDVTDTRRSEELRLAKEGAEAASRAKSAFLANMSHELRTPLNAILGYSEMLAEEAEERGLDDMLHDCARVREAGVQLLGLISDILDLTKIEAERLELIAEPIVIASLLTEVAGVFGPELARGRHRLILEHPDDLGTMTGDPIRIRQILLNLLGNALKFGLGAPGGAITLRAHTDHQRVHFAVIDSGPGMSEAQAATIFEPFTQVDTSATRRRDGAGLGLAICRSLCEHMGGKVSVVSAPGLGSTFYVELPLRPPSPPPA